MSVRVCVHVCFKELARERERERESITERQTFYDIIKPRVHRNRGHIKGPFKWWCIALATVRYLWFSPFFPIRLWTSPPPTPFAVILRCTWQLNYNHRERLTGELNGSQLVMDFKAFGWWGERGPGSGRTNTRTHKHTHTHKHTCMHSFTHKHTFIHTCLWCKWQPRTSDQTLAIRVFPSVFTSPHNTHNELGTSGPTLILNLWEKGGTEPGQETRNGKGAELRLIHSLVTATFHQINHKRAIERRFQKVVISKLARSTPCWLKTDTDTLLPLAAFVCVDYTLTDPRPTATWLVEANMKRNITVKAPVPPTLS